MKPRILIATKPRDAHAQIISAGLIELGAEVTRFMMSMMPRFARHSIELDEQLSFKDGEKEILPRLSCYDRFWIRRIGPSSLEYCNPHEDDLPFLKMTHGMYSRSVMSLLDMFATSNPEAVINSFSGKPAAESKILQLVVAKQCGLRVPATLVSNDKQRVSSFQKRHRNQIISKPLMTYTWLEERRSVHALTSMLPSTDLIDEESFEIQPAIFQEYVEKAFEVRVVIFGDRQFGITIDSQADQRSKVDWRARKLGFAESLPYELPEPTFHRCLDLLKRLGLRYGAFDFIVTPDKELVFLEVNEAGQFLFLEECVPELKLADAFCHYLMHGSLETWSAETARFSLGELEDSAIADGFRKAEAPLPETDRNFLHTKVSEELPTLVAS